jgi:hypothetical protein
MNRPEALRRDIQQALGRRDGAAAARLVDEALAGAPEDIDLRLQKAMALRLQGDLKGALAALELAVNRARQEVVDTTDALRVIMILDIWNPLLTEDEREAVTGLMNAPHDFFAV